MPAAAIKLILWFVCAALAGGIGVGVALAALMASPEPGLTTIDTHGFGIDVLAGWSLGLTVLLATIRRWRRGRAVR